LEDNKEGITVHTRKNPNNGIKYYFYLLFHLELRIKRTNSNFAFPLTKILAVLEDPSTRA
jgi:hypothetical protein